MAALLRHAGVVEEVVDIDSPKWMKLVLNAGELVPSAILDVSIAECARVPGMRSLMIEAGDEAIAVAQLDGLTVRPIFGMDGDLAWDPATYMETVLDELVAHYILDHSRSTILQDWMKGRRAEVREINGLVVDGLAGTAAERRSTRPSSSSRSTSRRAPRARPAQPRAAARAGRGAAPGVTPPRAHL